MFELLLKDFASKAPMVWITSPRSPPLTGMQDGEADDLFAFIAGDHIIIRDLAICGMAWLLEVDVQRIRLCVVRQPKIALWRLLDGWEEFQVLLNVCYGHSCFLLYLQPHTGKFTVLFGNVYPSLVRQTNGDAILRGDDRDHSSS